jgi:hypothetical protein
MVISFSQSSRAASALARHHHPVHRHIGQAVQPFREFWQRLNREHCRSVIVRLHIVKQDSPQLAPRTAFGMGGEAVPCIFWFGPFIFSVT